MREESAPSAVGVIGGSGLYQLDGMESIQEHAVSTPFGEPSDVIFSGRLAGRSVYFLPRHGRGHRLLPSELNHRANLWALRSLGVRWVLSATAVGSLKEAYRPRDLVIPDQFFDRMSRRTEHTFFGEGIVGHVDFADPTSARLRRLIAEAAPEQGLSHHEGGTYVNMDGPAFSTRAESEAHRQLGFDVVGMTNLPEAKLAREAEMAFATMAFITDYDCWKVEEEPVTAETVMGHLSANAEAAKGLLSRVLPRIPERAEDPEHRVLDSAILTPREFWPEQTREKLAPILKRLEG
jgi:5'-methylthioadenosine phosphorylase